MKKKILSVVLSLFMIISLLPQGISAVYAESNEESISVDNNSNISCTLAKTEYRYDGTEIYPDVKVCDGDKLLVEGEDYVLEYLDNIKPGKGTIIITFIGEYIGEITKNFTISPALISSCTVKLKKSTYTYGNKSYTPSVTVYDFYGSTVSKNNYVVEYKNNKKVGKATVTVKGKNCYTGTKKAYFNILPKVNKSSATLYLGQKYSIKTSATSKVSYKSSNSKVAKVDSKGVVTALKNGTAKITVKCNGQSSYVKITVKKPYIKIAKSKTVSLNSSAKISVKKIPANARVSWSSSNSKVATVNSNGVVKGKGVGNATITAKIKYAGYTYTSKCKVTVKIVIKMSKSSITLNNSYYQNLKVYGGSGKVTWKSSNKKIATVNSSGKVVGYGAGTCYIYAYRNGKRASCKVTVSSSYYENSRVPDFGAMFGIHRENLPYEDYEIASASYDITNYSNDAVAKMLAHYFDRLEKWGFSYYDSDEDFDSFTYSFAMFDPVGVVVVGYYNNIDNNRIIISFERLR